MKQLKTLLLIVVGLLLLSLTGCVRDDDNPVVHTGTSHTGPKAGGVTLGQQIENIYATSYMRNAYIQEYGLPSGVSTPVHTTHLYVKLHPQDTAQLSKIVDDTTIDAFLYPLDYELIGRGHYNQPAEDTGWVYAVVPLGNAILANVQHILIDSCCIPDYSETDLIELENKLLLKVFGPGEEPIPSANDDPEMPRVYGKPKGHIRVMNTSTGRVDPMRRVRVRLNTIVRCVSVYTNDNGYYEYTGFLSFITNVNYTVVFENRNNFKVWNNFDGFTSLLPDAMCLGIHNPNWHTDTVKTSDYSWGSATIFNAASVYYHHLWVEEAMNIGQPVNKLRIGYMPVVGVEWGGCTPMWHHRIYSPSEWYQYLALVYITAAGGFAVPDMMIWTPTDSSATIYKIVFHEMTHVSHYANVGNTYWSTFVRNTIANGDYGNGVSYTECVGVGEMWAYYAGIKAYKYYKSNYDNLMTDNFDRDYLINLNNTYWFRPANLMYLDSIVQDVNPHLLFQCMTPTNVNHCTFRQEIKSRLDSTYWHTVDSLFYELCTN